MNKEDQPKLWPFNPQTAILISLILLFFLFVMMAIIQKNFDWPSSGSEKLIYTGLFIISLAPILLAILQIIIERGGRIEYGPVKIDFAKIKDTDIPSFVVPANIGVQGQPVFESTTSDILDAFTQATRTSIVIIDLEGGQAWWETRLLVLLSGADRLGNPGKIVFVANKSGKEQCFVGWAYPDSLLKCLLKAHPKYMPAYSLAKAVSGQWSLIEPPYPSPNQVLPPWIQPKATLIESWATDFNTGLKNEYLEEQVLQDELSNEIEKQEGGKYITTGRIIDLFETVLNTNHLDLDDTSDEQLRTFFKDDLPYIALTASHKYSSIVSRMTLYGELLKQMSGIGQIKSNTEKIK